MVRPQTAVRTPRRALHAVVLLNKPLGLSSNDAVQKIKRFFNAEKAGHTGTLDPLATGVLPICLGAATKFSQIHLDANKSYLAQVHLGIVTETDDAEGAVLATKPVTCDWAAIERALDQCRGPIQQVPPLYSALKKEGKPLYEYARAGQRFDIPARPVTIHDLRLVNYEAPLLTIAVTCSKGTYIRALARDIGALLGCGAYMSALQRTATGPFTLENCVSLQALQDLREASTDPVMTLTSNDDDNLIKVLKSPAVLLQGLAAIRLNAEEAGRFLSGLRRRGDWPDAHAVSVWGPEPQALLGLAHVKAGELIPQRSLTPPEVQNLISFPFST